MVARAAFSGRGFAEVSLDDLAAQAGVTRGALHHHFINKAGLFEAVLRQVSDEMEAELQARWHPETDLWRGFCDDFTNYLDLTLEPSRRRILFQDAPAVLGARAYDILLDGAIEPIISDLKTLIDEGRVHPVDPEATAHFLNAGVLNIAFWVAEAPDGEERLPRAHATLQQMLDGLAINETQAKKRP